MDSLVDPHRGHITFFAKSQLFYFDCLINPVVCLPQYQIQVFPTPCSPQLLNHQNTLCLYYSFLVLDYTLLQFVIYPEYNAELHVAHSQLRVMFREAQQLNFLTA